MPKLFGVTLFVSATLLFLVQPMVGKMILPLLGGTPAVWNSCMVFFQALLLLGYYYAHKTSTRMPTRRQVAFHTGVLAAAAGALAIGAMLVENHSPVPVVKSLAPQGSDMPFFGVILLLAVAIGLPFFTVSTTAPLLQKWFSETGHPSAKDPYFLYAASNCGSLLALVAYPFVVEPNLRLVEQAWVWAAGFLVMTLLIVACGRAVLSVPAPRAPEPKGKKKQAPTPVVDEQPPSWQTRVRWLFLAAVPSSLMLAVTTDVTTDMVSMPLLWVIPLALYLITFIIVFTQSIAAQVHFYVVIFTPVLILLVVFTKVVEPTGAISSSDAPQSVQTLLYILPFVTFFFVALACHGELARTRPASKYLTTFYLTMSIGGMLGGLFNALIAPMVFKVVTEYPITLLAACYLLPPLSVVTNPANPTEQWRWSVWDFLLPIIFFAAGRYSSLYYDDIEAWFEKSGIGLPEKMAATIVAFGLPILASYFLVDRPFRFVASVGCMWLGVYTTSVIKEQKLPEESRTVYERSFFGTMKIERDRKYIRFEDGTIESSPPFRRLIHGTTVHGMQHRHPDAASQAQALWLLGANGPMDGLALAYIAEPHFEFPGREPLTYYHRSGPVGEMFNEFWAQNQAHPGRNTDVACVGLGTGTLSAYGRPGQKMTFFEIDTKVRRLVAADPEHPSDRVYFHYIDEAKRQGVDVEFIIGDARLSLEQTNRKWGFMLVDAFSSDSIPAHLLTKEAVRLYFDRLEDDGMLALHISNRYLKLEPVVERIVQELHHELGLEARVMHDFIMSDRSAFTRRI
ncbi:MAG TPA: hypothetical protein VKD71_06670, partial [Gemmataceae bacterium]|nr:hypothetical protein [Gemmataceae bacterium]